LKDEKA
jgi:long-subunit acyl-CoA synthetase (AMP-forming)